MASSQLAVAVSVRLTGGIAYTNGIEAADSQCPPSFSTAMVSTKEVRSQAGESGSRAEGVDDGEQMATTAGGEPTDGIGKAATG